MASTDAFVAALRQVRSENYVKGKRWLLQLCVRVR